MVTWNPTGKPGDPIRLPVTTDSSKEHDFPMNSIDATSVCRVLPYRTAPGPWQMACDESLLQHAAERGTASLRFYGWSEATVSLGYFQPQTLRREPELTSLPYVRRSTGGAAIVHHREVTYALALPPGSQRQPKESWICRMHHVIAAALEPLGVRMRSVVCGEEKKLGAVLCFLHHTPGDLTIDAHKVVGSAQRKWRSALLQHGSILLRQSPHTPALPGIAELTGCDLPAESVAEAVVKQLQSQTGWRMEPGEWTAVEQVEIERIRVEKYASAAWNDKR